MGKTSNKKYALIKDLMEATYSYRRKGIITDSNSIEEVIKTYPALQLVSEVCNLFIIIINYSKMVALIALLLYIKLKIIFLLKQGCKG